MPNEKTSIPCAVCRDLAPLVADGVASADSAALVRAHLAACPSCAAEWPALAAGTGAPPAAETPLPAGPDDARVLRRLRRRLKNRTALLLAAEALVRPYALAADPVDQVAAAASASALR